eukprot:519888_1
MLNIPIQDLQQFECAICKSLPTKTTIIQCSNGHLLCGQCYHNPNFNQKCPVCRIDMSMLIRNRTMENLLARCAPIECKYKKLGCNWSGMQQNRHDHESECRKNIIDADEALQLTNKSEALCKMLSGPKFDSTFDFEFEFRHDTTNNRYIYGNDAEDFDTGIVANMFVELKQNQILHIIDFFNGGLCEHGYAGKVKYDACVILLTTEGSFMEFVSSESTVDENMNYAKSGDIILAKNVNVQKNQTMKLKVLVRQTLINDN